MTRMINMAVIIFLFGCVLSLGAIGGEDASIEIDLSVGKKDFYTCEPLPIILEIRTLKEPGSYYEDEVTLKGEYDDGELVLDCKPLARIRPAGQKPLPRLLPKGKPEKRFVLITSSPTEKPGRPYFAPRTGKLSIWAEYSGKVASKTIEISIIAPSEKERGAFSYYISEGLRTLIVDGRYTIHSLKGAECFLDQYPSSSYSLGVFYSLGESLLMGYDAYDLEIKDLESRQKNIDLLRLPVLRRDQLETDYKKKGLDFRPMALPPDLALYKRLTQKLMKSDSEWVRKNVGEVDNYLRARYEKKPYDPEAYRPKYKQTSLQLEKKLQAPLEMKLRGEKLSVAIDLLSGFVGFEYRFEDPAKAEQKVDVIAENEPVAQVLDRVLKSVGLKYTIENGALVIR